MDYVEQSRALQAKGYARPLKYTVDKSLADPRWPFRYVYDQGELRCSEAARRKDRTCYVARGTEVTIAKESPSFVYLDVGCWADDADGKGTKRRDFGLVCGQHVYLCEFLGKPEVPTTSVPAVRDFFEGLAIQGCGARVVSYARARNVDSKTLQDSELYLLLGDLHLPPVSWFCRPYDLVSPPDLPLPDWLERAPAMAMATKKTHLFRAAYQWVASQKSPRKVSTIGGVYLPQNPDISGYSGADLVRFLRALRSLDPLLRKRLHFIQVGDLFELWVGRGYHLVPGPDGVPKWRFPNSPEMVAGWCLEVMIQNAPVFTALELLKDAGLAEIRYLGGNHDGYLMKPELAALLSLPTRQPLYRGLHGDLVIEHGHRFDSANHDNVNGKNIFKGPFVTMLLLPVPRLRELETPVGWAAELWSPKTRDGYLMGATLVYLHERMELQQKPFSIYVMAHSHRRMLTRFDIRTKYTSTAHEEGTRGEVRP